MAINKIKNIVFIIVYLVIIAASGDDRETTRQQLPFCGNKERRIINNGLLYVSTLDGKITTLDILKDGSRYWDIKTDPGSLISSSIHRLELTNNGRWVRMIPSLNGRLYKFDGENIDPIPITIDNLLSSSFKFSDDLVISGGKETRSYGVSTRTGQILYECSMNGCINATDLIFGKHGPLKSTENVQQYDNDDSHNPITDNVVIVRRQTQTVRAIEPRTGSERWNFSVGYHELDLLPNFECTGGSEMDSEIKIRDIDFRMIVPEGILLAYNINNPNNILWKYKFDHPIVNVWRVNKDGKVQSVDLFGSSRWLWNTENQEGWISPSIYVGMFQKQLYIQESKNLLNIISKASSSDLNLLSDNMPSIPWQPISVLNSGLNLVGVEKESEPKTTDEDITAVTALSILYGSEYVNGNGFFLFSLSDLNKTNTELCDSSNTSTTDATATKATEDFNFEFMDDDTPVKIIIVSVWFWWKEILVISLTSAIILNLFLSPRTNYEREVVVIEKHIPVPTAIEATEESLSRSRSSQRSLSESYCDSDSYQSRFLNDFDLVQCLGKGGFGVVFEAKNKIDDCNYAVKRIPLPNKKESRDRVLREVKTLANCEHQNIVRYFHAWIENPPPGWQEEEDKKWLQREFSTSIDIESPDGTTLPSYPNSTQNIKRNKIKKKNSELLSYNSNFKVDKKFKRSSYLSNSSSFIQFLANTNPCAIAINAPDDVNLITDGSESSDSFDIEFKVSSSYSPDYSKSDNNKIKEFSTRNYSISSNTNRHKRPLSLDLSSTGNVINYISSLQPNKVFLYIQMQLCRKQSLKDWLCEHKIEMRQPYIRDIFQQIVDAVGYVHLKGLIHRDLKPSNIFFSLDGKIKIGDFGLVTDTPTISMINSTSFENKTSLPYSIRHTQKVGTHLYMSPEQLEGRPYDYKVDIYSLGLILFELLVYFSTEMERIIVLKGLRNSKFPSEFKEMFPNEFELVNLMLSITPEQRPTTFQIQEKINIMRLLNHDKYIKEDIQKSLEFNTKRLSEISSLSS